MWNEQTASELFRVFNGNVILTKRVLSNNSFIFSTQDDGVKLLTIKDLATKQFSVHQLFEGKCDYLPDGLDLQITNSNLIIATASVIDREDFFY